MQILIPGHFSLDQLPPKTEGVWYAFTRVRKRSSLIQVKVRLRPAPHPSASGDLSVPGAIVETSSTDSVLFLVRGRGLKGRVSIPTWFIGDAGLAPGTSLAIRTVGPDRWQLSASRLGHWEVNPELVFRIAVGDKSTGHSQSLGRWLQGTSPRIQWIGDLDGDRRMDLYLRDSHESGAQFWRLYLSRGAKGKDLVSKAAEFYTPGC